MAVSHFSRRVGQCTYFQYKGYGFLSVAFFVSFLVCFLYKTRLSLVFYTFCIYFYKEPTRVALPFMNKI